MIPTTAVNRETFPTEMSLEGVRKLASWPLFLCRELGFCQTELRTFGYDEKLLPFLPSRIL